MTINLAIDLYATLAVLWAAFSILVTATALEDGLESWKDVVALVVFAGVPALTSVLLWKAA